METNLLISVDDTSPVDPNNDQNLLDNTSKVEAAQWVAYLVTKARLYPDVFLCDNVVPEIEPLILELTQGILPKIKALGFLCFCALMPALFARTAMEDECLPTKFIVHTNSSSSPIAEAIQRQECLGSSKSFLKTHGALAGEVLLLIFFANVLFLFLADQLFGCECCKPIIRVAYFPYRCMGGYLLSKLKWIRYQSTDLFAFTNNFSIDERDFVCIMYQSIIAEFATLALYGHNAGAAIAGFVLAEPFTQVADYSVGATYFKQSVIESKLLNWQPESAPIFVRGLPWRMHNSEGGTFSLNLQELFHSKAFHTTEDNRAFQKLSVQERGRQLKYYTYCYVSQPPKYIFIATTCEVIDVYEGVLKHCLDGSWSASGWQ